MTARRADKRSPTVAEAVRVAEFRAALRRFTRETERVARDCEITPAWYLLLLQIKGAPDLSERATVSALTERLQLAQSSVTELVARAAQAGLLEREASPDDARVVVLRLSPEGERRFAKAFRTLAAERRALRGTIAGLDD